jgi:ABC-type sugar transport system ATPase subunit
MKELLIDGAPVVLKNISDAQKRGIALIHCGIDARRAAFHRRQQHLLGNERRGWGVLNRLNRSEMNREAEILLHRVGLSRANHSGQRFDGRPGADGGNSASPSRPGSIIMDG